MKKKYYIHLLFILCLLSHPTQALNVTATSGSATDIQAAVNQVASGGGGNVFIPTGTFHWNGETVTIPTGVNVFGASYAGCKGHEDNWEHYTASTVLHNDATNDGTLNDMFVLDGTNENDKPSRISGIQFEIGDPPAGSESTSWGAGAILVKEAKNFRIDHCTFLNFARRHVGVICGYTPWSNEVGHSAYGLIDHCFLDTPYKDTPGDWFVSYGIVEVGNMQPKLNNWNPDMKSYAGNYQEISDVALVYVEDCNLRRLRHAIGGSNGGIAVSRYNLFDRLADEHEALWNSGELDQHPYWTSQYPQMFAENYYNTFTNPNMHRDCPDHPNQPHSHLAIDIRGGSALIFGNNYSQSEPAPNYGSVLVYLREETVNETVDKINNVFIWNNTYTNVWTADTNNDGVIDGYVRVGTDGKPYLNEAWFLRAPTLAQDGWIYTPYIYPHPLTLEGAPELPTPTKYKIEGKLIDKNNNLINSSIVILQEETIANSTQTDSNGNYNLEISSGTYDIQFNILNFFIQNFFIRLLSINIASNLKNIVNYITNINNQNVSFITDINANQLIQTYSPQKPARVLINGTQISEAPSYSQLINNNWFYNFSTNRLYILANASAPLQICSDGTHYNQCSSTKPLYCDNGNLINKCSVCSCSSGQSCNITDETCYTIQGQYNTFGYTTIGAGWGWTASSDGIFGSVFTIPENGVAENISVALRRASAGSDNIKCAIYKHSDLSLVGSTEQVTASMTTTFAWYTFNFVNPRPSLTVNTEYLLMVFVDYTGTNILMAYDIGNVDQGHYYSTSYDGFPNPLPYASHNDRKASIYASYTPS